MKRNPARYPRSHWQTEVVKWYYYWLNRNSTFVIALQALFDSIAALGVPSDLRSEEPMVLQVLERLAQLDWLSQEEADDIAARLHRARLGKQRDDLLEAFCKTWHLPPRAKDDLLASFNLRVLNGDILCLAPEAEAVPRVGQPIEVARFDTGTETIRVVKSMGMISVNVHVAFEYQPATHGGNYLKGRIAELYAQIKRQVYEQARKLEQEAQALGYQGRPRRWSSDYFKHVAKAIYLRAIEARSWEDVMTEYSGEIFDVSRFADRIRTYARAANISL